MYTAYDEVSRGFATASGVRHSHRLSLFLSKFFIKTVIAIALSPT